MMHTSTSDRRPRLRKLSAAAASPRVGSEDAREERLPLETTLGSFDKEDRY